MSQVPRPKWTSWGIAARSDGDGFRRGLSLHDVLLVGELEILVSSAGRLRCCQISFQVLSDPRQGRAGQGSGVILLQPPHNSWVCVGERFESTMVRTRKTCCESVWYVNVKWWMKVEWWMRVEWWK